MKVRVAFSRRLKAQMTVYWDSAAESAPRANDEDE